MIFTYWNCFSSLNATSFVILYAVVIYFREIYFSAFNILSTIRDGRLYDLNMENVSARNACEMNKQELELVNENCPDCKQSVHLFVGFKWSRNNNYKMNSEAEQMDMRNEETLWKILVNDPFPPNLGQDRDSRASGRISKLCALNWKQITREKTPLFNVSEFWCQPYSSWKFLHLYIRKLPFRSSSSCRMRMIIIFFRIIVKNK